MVNIIFLKYFRSSMFVDQRFQLLMVLGFPKYTRVHMNVMHVCVC